jgi:hypothetical protein
VALNTTANRIDGVIVVDCGGVLIFDEESISLRMLVKDLLKESRKSCSTSWMSRTLIATAWVL